MSTAAGARQVSVERLTFQAELTNVIRGSAMVIVAVWMYLAATLGSGADARRTLLPFQTMAPSLPSTGQRMFRELQEGLLEAEAARSTTGAWPAVASLVEGGIPPFAPDPTVKTAVYQWTLFRTGAYVNYLGIPDRAGTPAWVLLVQEPVPGVPPDQAFEDEEHHRLADGAMLHVSTWTHADGSRIPARITTVPQNEGWTQVYAVAPRAVSPAAILSR
jgi:hypothetical protein